MNSSSAAPEQALDAAPRGAGQGSPPRDARLAVLVSGRGSNMRAIVEAMREERWPARVVAVLAHREDIPAVILARELGLLVEIVPLVPQTDRASQDLSLSQALSRHQPDWVVLAGYMRILSTDFVRAHAGRLVNIHPSLLPSFGGLHTHRRALAAGVKLHGATVHLVGEALDDGPILGQAVVPVLPQDDEHSLAQRVLRAEHRLYPRVLQGLISGRILIEGRRSGWRDAPGSVDPLLLLPEPG